MKSNFKSGAQIGLFISVQREIFFLDRSLTMVFLLYVQGLLSTRLSSQERGIGWLTMTVITIGIFNIT